MASFESSEKTMSAQPIGSQEGFGKRSRTAKATISKPSFVIRVGYNAEVHDPAGSSVKSAVRELGVFGLVDDVRAFSVYTVEGDLSKEQVEEAGRELFADPIVQNFSVNATPDGLSGGWLIEVRNRPGVTDAVGESTKNAIAMLGIGGVRSVQSGVDYFIKGELDQRTVETVCEKVLANRLIHEWRLSKIA